MKARFHGSFAALTIMAAAVASLPWPAQAQPVTPAQQATAQQVAQDGVALSALAPNAPDRYTIKRGDTLWGISRLYLKSPWRWPELWGMNKTQIRNPHLIYPGQTLHLDKSGGRARLRMGDAGMSDTVRLTPRTRVESLADLALPTLQTHLIEPFLAEPLVVDESTLKQAPRIVASKERVLLSKGDRAYARGEGGSHPMYGGADGTPGQQPRMWRVFRNAVPLKDPYTQEILGYEGQYVGKAELVRSEYEREILDQNSQIKTKEIVPATIDIIHSKEEMRAGDRLLPEPRPQLRNYTPHAPDESFNGAAVVSVYGSAVRYVAQNQVIAINKGTVDGMEVGHVLAILAAGSQVRDNTDPAKPMMRLPDERNGVAMVFRTFDRVSYALVMEITEPVKVGDRLVRPDAQH